MSAKFFLGSKDGLLNLLGLPYGVLAVEGCSTATVVSMEQGGNVLREALADGHLTEVEADEISTAMTEAGLPKDMAAIFEAARGYKLPEDFEPVSQLKVCDCPLPLPHGRIVNAATGRATTPPILTLKSGMARCRGAVNEKLTIAMDALSVFQGMLAAGLPADDAELIERLRALSPEELKKLGADDGGVAVVEIHLIRVGG
jgi:hypothetical protein